MINNTIIVLDGQAGSCGKGKFCGYIAKKYNIDIAINNWGSNAGHTYVTEDNKKIVLQHIPCSLVNEHTQLLIGPGAIITPEILTNEIDNNAELLNHRKIVIHPRAMIIKEKHREFERQNLKNGSTFKGCGSATAEKVLRLNDVELMRDYYNKLPSSVKNTIVINDTVDYMDNEKSILIEGSQGFDLDINYGINYPYVTSRQCNASQLIADCGIAPFWVKDIIMVIRPYPIRISNKTELGVDCFSGDYSNSNEITWEEIKQRCNAPEDVDITEYTTVTKKVRRVFEMNWDRLKYAVKINCPTQIALNFVQYIDWNAYKCKEYEKLSQKVKEFIKEVEDTTGVPVTLIGTGPNNDDIIDLK